MTTMEQIDGHKVVHTFTVLWKAWECDDTGWVTDDGRVWLTSHGGLPYEARRSELLGRMEEALDSLSGILKALALMDAKESPE